MIGDKIKELRTGANMSRKELADKLNLSLSTISMYERNERKPTINNLSAIADLFHVTINYFIVTTSHSNQVNLDSVTNDPILSEYKSLINDYSKLEPMQQDIIQYLIMIFLSYSSKR